MQRLPQAAVGHELVQHRRVGVVVEVTQAAARRSGAGVAQEPHILQHLGCQLVPHRAAVRRSRAPELLHGDHVRLLDAS